MNAQLQQIVAEAIAKASAPKAERPTPSARYVAIPGGVLDQQTGSKGRTPHHYVSAEAYARHLNDQDARVNDPSHESYWTELAEKDLGDRRVVAGGKHYTLGDGTGTGRGHSGRPVRVKYFTGAELVTTDLWFQGEIPDAMAHLFTENATIEEAR